MDRRTDLIEIDIRGRFIMMACDIEYTLLHIMMYSTPDPFNQIRRFEGMMMHNKIDNAIADLKRYKPILYAEYESELEKLYDFKIIRNHMSHHKIHFHKEPDLSTFRVVFVGDDNGVERMGFIEYPVQFVIKKVEEFRVLNVVLAGLAKKLMDEYNSNTPPLPTKP